MNILVISSILPLTKAFHDNDFIFHLYGNYRDLYKNDRLVIIKPVKYDLNIRTLLKGNTRLQKIKGNLHWNINGFQVEVFPYFAAWTIRNLHALVSRTIFVFNRKRLESLLDTYKFDIIHARFIFPDGLLAYFLNKNYGIPYLVSTHNELFYFNHFYSRKIALRILKNASFVLPGSYINFEHFTARGIKNVCQMPHGFYNEFIKEQRNEPDKILNVLTVGQLIKLKNIDKVMEALYNLKNRYPFSYTIIGTGPEKTNLQNMANRLGLQRNIVFIDHVPHSRMADEMYKHDIFIMPSYFETFGRVYFEVMAMGIPIICAKYSGIYGLFRDREEGIAVDHRSLGEITRALDLLMGNRDERLRIGRNGQSLVKRYTWEQISTELHSKYLSAITSEVNTSW